MSNWIGDNRWNSILTLLNEKRVAMGFPSISHTFSDWVKQSDINCLRDGLIEILPSYGYTLATALTAAGYGYSTWKTWAFNWIAEVSLDEIEDILNILVPVVSDQFQFSIQTTVPNETFTLPLSSPSGTFNFIVDWGDGNSNEITSYYDIDKTHTYVSPGVHIITMTGICSLFKFSLGGDKLKIIELLDFVGDMGFTDMNFAGCSNLIKISANMRNIKSLTTAENMFVACSSLESIPAGIFDGCIGILSFKNTFSGCSSIVSIPSNLFEYNTEVTTFEGTFNLCISLTSIPSGIFDYNTKVTTFWNVFLNCISLTGAIPSNLFDNNTLVTTFRYAFGYCSGLSYLDTNIFNNNNLVTDFYGTFYRCSGMSGTAPALWSRIPVPIGTSCFYNCSGLSNYWSIPPGWRQP